MKAPLFVLIECQKCIRNTAHLPQPLPVVGEQLVKMDPCCCHGNAGDGGLGAVRQEPFSSFVRVVSSVYLSYVSRPIRERGRGCMLAWSVPVYQWWDIFLLTLLVAVCFCFWANKCCFTSITWLPVTSHCDDHITCNFLLVSVVQSCDHTLKK